MLWALAIGCAPALTGYAFGAVDTSLTSGAGGHGMIFAGTRIPDVATGTLDLWLNTDTLHARLGEIELAPSVVFGAQLDGEAIFAGILTDYYAAGVRNRARGFNASYLAATADIALSVGRHTFKQALTGRRWFFGRKSGTRDDFVLPDTGAVFEERISYWFWSLDDEPSLREWHRTTQRLRGLAFGVEGGVDVRQNDSPWGAIDDPRNRPDRTIVRVRQWFLGGLALGDDVRLQLREWAGAGAQEDDLSRTRIGGSNPYAVPLVGAPWPAFLASTYAAAEISVPIRVGDSVEVGLLADGAAIIDRERNGSGRFGGVAGVGAFVDIPVGTWQFDVRSGWSPDTHWQTNAPQISGFLAIGRML
ncbi:MAG: hypothetical protein H7Z43_08420 [Clostridia bacterium]|nr:hypothetical protein [Deltaproteobacteria bacterium]